MSSLSSKNDRLLKLLQVQNLHVEEYCNAQTTLGNILMTRKGVTGGSGKSKSNSNNNPIRMMMMEEEEESSSSPELVAVSDLQKSLEQVKKDWKSLRQLLLVVEEEEEGDNNTQTRELDRVVVSLLQDHLDLTSRVLETVYPDPSYHTNGIPITTTSGSKPQQQTTKMVVALAALRASTSRIMEALK